MKWNTASYLASAKWLTAIIAATWLGFPVAVQAMVIMMGIDFATGLIKGISTKTIDSDISIKGLLKKIATCAAILIIHLLDGYILPLLGVNAMEIGLEKVFAIYICFNEVLSIIENLAESGVSFPSVVISVLATAKKSVAAPATQAQVDDLIGNHILDSITTEHKTTTTDKTTTTTATSPNQPPPPPTKP